MKAVIFDFDGVLADTYDFNKRMTKEVGHDVSHEIFKAHHDGNVFEKPKIQFTDESAGNFFNKYFDGIDTIKPFFDLNDINELHSKYSLYIISSTKEASIKKFLKFNNVSLFEEVLGRDFHKSKVEKFKYLLKEKSLTTKDCIFVTDTLGDILEANQLGIKTIAVDYGFHDKERLEKGNPFKIVSSFKDIIKVIESL
jgi:phosphoglycolate phosphatase